MAEEAVLCVSGGAIGESGAGLIIREVSCCFLVFCLLFCEEASECDDVGVNLFGAGWRWATAVGAVGGHDEEESLEGQKQYHAGSRTVDRSLVAQEGVRIRGEEVSDSMEWYYMIWSSRDRRVAGRKERRLQQNTSRIETSTRITVL